MLYILDTDHLTLLQYQDANVATNLKKIAQHERAVTVISLIEQVEGRLAAIRRARNESDAAIACHYLLQTIEFYKPLRVLPYSDAAVVIYNQLRQQKIRIGTQDLRIASIALGLGATVATRNRRDFAQIPSLQMVDWTANS